MLGVDGEEAADGVPYGPASSPRSCWSRPNYILPFDLRKRVNLHTGDVAHTESAPKSNGHGDLMGSIDGTGGQNNES